MVCLKDACQAESPEHHTAALAYFKGYGTLINVAAFEAAMVVPMGGES